MEFFLGAFENDWERRRAAILYERSIRKRGLEEEEVRRRGGSAGAEPRVGRGGRGIRWKVDALAWRKGARIAEPSMRTRFRGLASGSQPAVVKLVSFGGGGRLGAMINYVSRDGSVAVENERGEQLRGQDALAAVRSDWDHLMSNRAESRDIGTFTITVRAAQAGGSDPYDLVGGLLKRALGDRSFVFTVDRNQADRSLLVNGVAVLRDSAGERLTADRKASEIVQDRLCQGHQTDSVAAFRFTGHGNGVDYGTSRVRALVERSGDIVRTESGQAIEDPKQAGDLVQLEWRGQLHSRKVRDVMHVVISARAGTDAKAFRSAAREFLSNRFAGHRYVFSMHDPSQDPKSEETGGKRPHVHVHVIAAMRSDAGDRIETTIGTFREWRVAMAEKARAHGIDMEMTDRRDRASAPAYTKNHVRPISYAGRTEHEGTSIAADARYRGKRGDSVATPRTQRSANYSDDAARAWSDLAADVDSKNLDSYSRSQVLRLERARSEHDPVYARGCEAKVSGSRYRTNIVMLGRIISEAENVRQMTREEFRAYERQVDTALLNARQVMPESEKASFEEIASAARDHVDARRELMENAEQQARSKAAERGREEVAKPKDLWDRAVARHGLEVVRAANDVMLAVEHYRERIDRAEAGDDNADKSKLQAGLNLELARAGELGAAGNGLVREIAEMDQKLRLAVEAARRSRERGDRRDVGTTLTQVRGERRDEGAVGYVPGDQRQTTDGSRSRNTRGADENSAPSRGGDTNRSGPVQQHVPRIEQLQRDAEDDQNRHAKDRNDRDR